MSKDEEFSAITDKIPQRPVTVVEGTSYTLLIIAALGVSFLSELCLAVNLQNAWSLSINILMVKDDDLINQASPPYCSLLQQYCMLHLRSSFFLPRNTNASILLSIK